MDNDSYYSIILQNIIDITDIIYQLMQEGKNIARKEATSLSFYIVEHIKCYLICENDEIHYIKQKKMLKHLEELMTYIENNRQIMPNYGEQWWYGETITSSFVESTVNEVVTKRMVKKQQMQWLQIGAHYLLQASYEA